MTRRNIKTPRGTWPAPYEIDSAVNKRAQAMARAKKGYTRAESNAQARKIVARLFGRNAHVEAGAREQVATLLWNDYQSYGPRSNPRTVTARATRTIRKGETFRIKV